MKKYLLLSILIAFIFSVGCKDDEVVPKKSASLLSFMFSRASNSGLSQDIRCTIGDDNIVVLIQELTSAESLIPTFTGNFEKVTVNGEEQTSGLTPQNFNQTVTYVLTGEDGKTRSYEVTVKVYTGLPIVRIETDGRQSITSKEDYVNGTVSISKTPDFESGYEGTMRIRGRGNATWFSYPKKPYRIKLDNKSEILGMPADKDWVLLAEYCDKSMLRSTYAFELSKLVGLPWTPRGYHVEVFLNGSYDGTYFMGEHVKVAKDRANIDDDGYLFENDGYWAQEPIWFSTDRTGIHFTFKHPDTDDLVVGDEKYTFIQNFMNEFEAVLYSNNFKDPSTGYRKYLDAENFAQWYLVQETIGNIDTNPYYALESRTGKLKMYPVWDFEWCLGLAAIGSSGWATPPTISPVEQLYRRDQYYSRLFQDPYFVDIVKTEWQKMKSQYLPALANIVKEKKENIKYAQKQNFSRWQILGQYTSVGLTNFKTWEEEVEYAADFLQRRVEWLDTQIPNW